MNEPTSNNGHDRYADYTEADFDCALAWLGTQGSEAWSARLKIDGDWIKIDMRGMPRLVRQFVRDEYTALELMTSQQVRQLVAGSFEDRAPTGRPSSDGGRSMSLIWYVPKRLKIEDLQGMGVTLKDPRGRAIAYVHEETNKVLCEVGDVAIYRDGHISVWPRRGVTLRRILPALLTSAEEALMGRHYTRDGWWRIRTSKSTFWRCTVLVELQETDELALALRKGLHVRAEDDQDRDRRLVEDVR